MHISVIIPAAGASRRYRQGLSEHRSKLDEDTGGRPMLQRTVELFHTRPEVGSIVVAGPADDEAFAAFELRYGDRLRILGVELCRGGIEHRYETVREALAHVPEAATRIAVHDAARPCTPVEVIDRVFAAAERHPAVIPGLDVADTLKRASERPDTGGPADPLASILPGNAEDNRVQTVDGTVDRSGLIAVQTPQVFEADLLRRAYAQDDLSSTDDAQLVERLGEPVVVVPGDPRNIKITVPSDLVLARAIGGWHGAPSRPAHKKF